MSEDQNNAVIESVAEAMETLAFVSPMPAENSEQPQEAVAVAIPFYGSRQGTLLLAASRQLGAVLAGNILGTDPSDPEAQQKAMDALRELANITCGLWLRKTAEDNGGKCEMQVPECHEISTPEEWQKLVGTAAGVLDAEGFLVATVVRMAA